MATWRNGFFFSFVRLSKQCSRFSISNRRKSFESIDWFDANSLFVHVHYINKSFISISLWIISTNQLKLLQSTECTSTLLCSFIKCIDNIDFASIHRSIVNMHWINLLKRIFVCCLSWSLSQRPELSSRLLAEWPFKKRKENRLMFCLLCVGCSFSFRFC